MDPVATSPQATSDVSFCQPLAFVFGIGSERVSVATRQVAGAAPQMAAEQDQDRLFEIVLIDTRRLSYCYD